MKNETVDLRNIDFRRYLEEEFSRRTLKNPSYSLRAFTRDLGLTLSTVSDIFNGKRKVSQKVAEKIAQVFEWDFAKILELRKKSTKQNFQVLLLDQFNLASSWEAFAVLELLKVKDFTPKVQWIGRKLGLSFGQVKTAIDSLVRAGLLEITAENEWIDKSEGHSTYLSSNDQHEAAKRLQKDYLEKSLESLKKDTLSKRNHTGMTMAINSKDITLAKNEIAKFRKRMTEIMENVDEKDGVYQLTINFFPLTHS